VRQGSGSDKDKQVDDKPSFLISDVNAVQKLIVIKRTFMAYSSLLIKTFLLLVSSQCQLRVAEQ